MNRICSSARGLPNPGLERVHSETQCFEWVIFLSARKQSGAIETKHLLCTSRAFV